MPSALPICQKWDDCSTFFREDFVQPYPIFPIREDTAFRHIGLSLILTLDFLLNLSPPFLQASNLLFRLDRTPVSRQYLGIVEYTSSKPRAFKNYSQSTMLMDNPIIFSLTALYAFYSAVMSLFIYWIPTWLPELLIRDLIQSTDQRSPSFRALQRSIRRTVFFIGLMLLIIINRGGFMDSNNPSGLIDYKNYKELSRDQKRSLLSQPKQAKPLISDLPNEDSIFPEENWIDVFVVESQSSLWRTTTKQIRLATYRYKSTTGSLKAIVVLFHGLTSYVGEGAFIAKTLAGSGIEVVGFDQRGFGKSQGRRGYIRSLAENMEDSDTFLCQVQKLYPQTPVYLCGLSMGGLICFNLGLKYPKRFKGLILMAPALKSYHGSWAVYLFKALCLISTFIQVPKSKEQKRRSRKATEDQSYEEDPYLYTDSPYANTLKCVLESINQSQNSFSQLECDRLLLIQGGKDRTVDPDGIIELYETCKCKDKTILFYQDMWHNVWREEEIHDILPRLVAWLNK